MFIFVQSVDINSRTKKYYSLSLPFKDIHGNTMDNLNFSVSIAFITNEQLNYN
jgi:hypothetical protein